MGVRNEGRGKFIVRKEGSSQKFIDPVKCAIANCLKVPITEALDKELGQIADELSYWETYLAKLFPGEYEAKKTIGKRIEVLKSHQKEINYIKKFAPKYPEFPLEVLAWHDDEKQLQFAIVSVYSERGCLYRTKDCKEISWDRECHGGYVAHKYDCNLDPCPFPERVMKIYQECSPTSVSENKYCFYFRFVFYGLLPDEIRGKVKENQDDFSHAIFIITELTRERQTANPRCLLVGWDGFRMWLIAEFRAITIEDCLNGVKFK